MAKTPITERVKPDTAKRLEAFNAAAKVVETLAEDDRQAVIKMLVRFYEVFISGNE